MPTWGLRNQGTATRLNRWSCAFDKAVVQGITGAAHRADRIGGTAPIEGLAQSSDVNVDRALVNIHFAPPDAVEQLLARKHPTGVFHQEFKQPEFGRSQRDIAAGARNPLFLAIEL